MDDVIKSIKEYKEVSGKPYYKIAGELGCTEANISRWINGKVKMSPVFKEMIGMKLKKLYKTTGGI